jgi:serine/threonine protein kinase
MSEEVGKIIDNKYEIEKLIDYGGYGDVYLVINISNKIKYASKVLKKERASKNDLALFENEINILNELSKKDDINKYISKLIDNGIGEIKNKDEKIEQPIYRQYLVMDYFENGNLFYYIDKMKNGMEEIHAKIIFKKILEGINFCHKNNICHLDIKTENILLDKDFNPVIIDFGLSHKCKDSMVKLEKGRGTYKYMCPEIVNKKNITFNGIKADIFSLGVLLFNLVTGKYCFNVAISQDSCYKFIVKKNYESFWKVVNLKNKIISDDLKDLYIRMISRDPNERPSIEEILEMNWMKELKDLDEDQYEKVENDIRKNFLELAKTIEGDNNEELKVEEKNDHKNTKIPSRSMDDENKSFDSEIRPKKFDNNKFANHSLKIKGYFNPNKFMNYLSELIKKDFDYFKFSEEDLSMKAIFDTKQYFENEDIEEENEDEDDDDNESKCIINISLVESEQDEYYIQFLREKGGIEEYYEKFLNIKRIIKEIIDKYIIL